MPELSHTDSFACTRSSFACTLLKYKDDIEDICLGAVKEADIEIKLKQVVTEWSVVNLQFTNFKLRGELFLRPPETLKVIGLLEDSILVS